MKSVLPQYLNLWFNSIKSELVYNIEDHIYLVNVNMFVKMNLCEFIVSFMVLKHIN